MLFINMTVALGTRNASRILHIVVDDECKHCVLWIKNMTRDTSESIKVLSNGWAIDTTAPVDLKNSKDNEVSRISMDANGPLRVVCFKIRMTSTDLMCPSLVVIYVLSNFFCNVRPRGVIFLPLMSFLK